jgi:hypothetical protein
MAEYIEAKAKAVVGITDQFEGVIKEREGQQNVQQSIQATNAALEPYFYFHELVKKELLTQLAENAKYVAKNKKSEHISYYTDDMGTVLLRPDYDLLENAIYGIYIKNATKNKEINQIFSQYIGNAIQAQTLELSTLAKFLEEDDLTQAVEFIKVGEENLKEFQEKMKQIESENMRKLQAEKLEAEKQAAALEHDRKIDIENVKGEWDLKKAAIVGVGFDEEKDRNNNSVPDILEHAKHLLEVQKLQYQKSKDFADRKLKEKEINKKAITKK